MVDHENSVTFYAHTVAREVCWIIEEAIWGVEGRRMIDGDDNRRNWFCTRDGGSEGCTAVPEKGLFTKVWGGVETSETE